MQGFPETLKLFQEFLQGKKKTEKGWDRLNICEWLSEHDGEEKNLSLSGIESLSTSP
jgi:hypothetical protein